MSTNPKNEDENQPSENLHELYELALTTRTRYRDSVWTRYGQFLTLQGLLIAALGLASEIRGQQEFIVLAVGIFGVLLSILWLFGTDAAKRSLEAWEHVLERLSTESGDESYSFPPIFSWYSDEKEETKSMFQFPNRVKRYEYIVPSLVLIFWAVVVVWGIQYDTIVLLRRLITNP